jgi:predicted O-linked N-acetylglucosamine transferase (SPINDLY family)
MSDDQVAEQIRNDRIDILVDLTLHMAQNRLLVFARKPAPVQITFAGYPGTTGLTTIDYRLTDPYLDPPNTPANAYSEESIRLQHSFWCFDPLETDLTVNTLPALTNGYVTFGCLNNFCKVNPTVLTLWSQVLQAVPESRMIILSGEGSQRELTMRFFAAEGILPERVRFIGHQPRQRYLQTYQSIDIGLDTLPYNGHATSLDSYWMGVPVVTLLGDTVVGRAGYSQLQNLGLPELIASRPEEYVSIAQALAKDLPQLGNLRDTLRDRMQASPLMNACEFTQSIESAYREMWQRWCRQ